MLLIVCRLIRYIFSNKRVKQRALIRQFGLEVRRRRTKLGLTQEDFAAASGLHRTYISGIERGARNPTLEIILRISRALKCEPSEILPSNRNEPV